MAPAFDQRRPPPEEILDDCVHVGFCLPACPTYLLWGEEMDSPRGRITLMEVGLEPGSEMTEEMVVHWDRCLGCMACVTVCPAGVSYDRLIEATRPQVERRYRRSVGARLWRKGLFAIFTHPQRLQRVLPLLRLYRTTGLRSIVAPLLRRFPRLAALERLAPRAVGRPEAPPGVTPARAARRGRVGLLQGCVQRVLFGYVNAATARVLAAEGYEVHAPLEPDCCGALQLHSGYEDAALDRARRLTEVFEDFDYVVTNVAGCGSSMKEYGHLLQDDPVWSDRAARFSAKVRDVSELLVEEEPIAERHPLPMRVAYQDACHLAHAQRVRAQPRTLLAGIPELEVVEPAEWDICCGSAGIYNLLQPEAARELGRRKARNLLATEAEAIVTGNPGCALQISAELEVLGRPLPVYHTIELLDRSFGGQAGTIP